MSSYLKEAEELEKRWANATKNYNPFGDQFSRSSTAVLLENQRLMNENRNPEPELGEFKRINIPLVRRILPQVCNHPIQSPIVDVTDPNLKIWGRQEPTPPKRKKKQLRSLDDEWEA